MESIDIWGKIAEQGLYFVLFAAGILYFYKENKILKEKIEKQDGESRTLTNDVIRIVTLTNDKLEKDQGSNETTKEIYRIVGEIHELLKSKS